MSEGRDAGARRRGAARVIIHASWPSLRAITGASARPAGRGNVSDTRALAARMAAAPRSRRREGDLHRAGWRMGNPLGTPGQGDEGLPFQVLMSGCMVNSYACTEEGTAPAAAASPPGTPTRMGCRRRASSRGRRSLRAGRPPDVPGAGHGLEWQPGPTQVCEAVASRTLNAGRIERRPRRCGIRQAHRSARRRPRGRTHLTGGRASRDVPKPEQKDSCGARPHEHVISGARVVVDLGHVSGDAAH